MAGSEHVDVLIVGAGLSGIGAGHQIRDELPGKTFAILEQRQEIGGTWSLFRYPGIRSDSDMHTLGYRFRPWLEEKAIADGPSILRYIHDTARDGDVERHVRLGKRVVAADWSYQDSRWTVTVQDVATGAVEEMTCHFLFTCGGYYRYDEGYTPAFEGVEDFRGVVVHPQHWPEDLDYAGKRVVVIGSGATAVTLVPAMAQDAAHVTMLQRSPTYIVALPGKDDLATRLRKLLPGKTVYSIVRWKNILRVMFSFELSRRRPDAMKRILRKMIEPYVAREDIRQHFTPRYNPWEQRLCVVPDGDLFKALHAGTASIVTAEIDRFTETGIRLTSGEEIPADIIVTATGLQLLAFGGIELSVEGEPVELPKHTTYKSIMLDDVPNFVYAIGYTNASWTLKIDLTYDYVWRLIRHMDATGTTWCAPRLRDPSIEPRPMLDFNAGYVLRSIEQFPRSGSKDPWAVRMNYIADRWVLGHGSVDDGAMEFGTGQPQLAAVREPAVT